MKYQTILLFIVSSVALFGCAFSEDCYRILGVERNATADQIKRAYKKLALKYHPDKNKNDKDAQEMFIKVSKAYETLKDKDKKQQYDMFGEASESTGGRGFGGFRETGGFREEPFHFNFKFPEARDFNFHNFEDDTLFHFGNDHGFGGGDSFFGEFSNFFQDDFMKSQQYSQQASHHSDSGRNQRQGRQCRTVTERVGNTITTYTQCF